MTTKKCPTCNGTGRVEVEKMNVEAIKTILRKGIKHWTHHAQRNIDKKVVVEECLKNIMMYSDKALEELEKEEPEPPPPDPFLVGNSWRQVLWMAWGELPWETPSGIKDFTEYEEVILNSGQNYVRHNVIPDIDFLTRHLGRMKGIRSELTFEEVFGSLDNWRDIINEIKTFPVIIECMNEFLDDWNAINKAREIMDYALEQGCEVSGGAWGNSSFGEKIANDFLKYHKGKYWTVHRPYPPLKHLQDYIRKRVKAGYKVLFNEILPYGTPHYIEPKELEAYIRGAKDAGAIGFNIYKDDFALAGKLCKEFNP